jgi:3',5'-nucleoside bisphosphate phosphatase
VHAPALRPVWADLHVHTVVSPCAEVEMIPPLIVRRARELGLGLIAITDHNTAENTAAVVRAAQGSGVTVLPGMELQTQEEVHLLCLFDTVAQALDWQTLVYERLPALRNRADLFGAQYVVDETGELIRENERLLLTATSLPIDEAVALVRQRGGLPIAAHVDRMANGLLTNLGFVPPGLELAALEISMRLAPAEATQLHPQLAGWPRVRSGDARRLSEMSASMLLTLREPCLAELELAFQGVAGRRGKLFP